MKKLLLLVLLGIAIAAHARPSLLDSLGLDADVGVPPTVDEAFDFSAQVLNPHTVIARWNVAEGNYIYRDKIRFEILDNKQVRLGEIYLPAGDDKMDEIFGLTKVYQQSIDVLLPLNRDPASQQFQLKAYYQGCSETFHICYPPTEKTISLSLASVVSQQPFNNALPTVIAAPMLEVPDQDRIAKSLAQDSLVKILFGFFGLGLLLAFTPCVFPMIPILSSIIIGESETITTRRAFILSLSYVLAMSITYTTAGVLTGLLGENLQVMFQNPWIIGSFSGLFVILALSMFGIFELQLPHSLQHRLHKISHQQQGGKVAGAALMGLLSGLIIGPCLAPPLAGALIFIGQHGEPVLGGSALFALSMGMGVPLLAIGTSAGTLLPKVGNWMNDIKAIFGVLLLALAIWMLERIIPGWASLMLWGGLLIIAAIYLGAFNALGIGSSAWAKLLKGLAIILLIYGGLLIVGGASGSHNIWQPLHGLATTQQSHNKSAGLNFIKVNNLADIDQQLAQSNQPALLDFYADWCVDCKIMEATTFKDANVKIAVAGTRLLQLDMTANTAEHKAVLTHFGIFGPPTILFFNAQGDEHNKQRLVGSISATKFINHLATLPQQTQ